MKVEMDFYQLSSYLKNCHGYDDGEAECLAGFFYERGWDGINIDSYIANSNIHILEPDIDVEEYIQKNKASDDWTVMKADNGYHYLEFY